MHKQSDDWLLMVYWSTVNAKQRKIWRSSRTSSYFRARFLTEVLLGTKSIWNSRCSIRLQQALGLLIHHLINSALLYLDVGPVAIFLLHTSSTSNTFSSQVESKPVGNCRAEYTHKVLWSDAYFMWNEQNALCKAKQLIYLVF